MTGNAFLKRLKFQLDFLSTEDQKAVLGFYEKKLKNADTLTQEEEIVKSFGSPERIAEKLKEVFLGQNADAKPQDIEKPSDDRVPSDDVPDSTDLKEDPVTESNEDGTQKSQDPSEDLNPEDLTLDHETKETDRENSEAENMEEHSATNEDSAIRDAFENEEEHDDADDLIFSKPTPPENTPEIIHSLENKEITPLFGEKVVIEQRSTPVEEIILEPMDQENGLTPQEIEIAKAETLEKAQKFDEDTFHEEEESSNVTVEESPAQADEEETVKEGDLDKNELSGTVVSPYQLDPQEEETSVEFVGVFKKMFATSSLSKGTVTFVTVLLSILTSPLLILPFAAGIISYAALTFIIILLSILVFALIAALVVGGVIELIYGFAMLFDTVSVALIEIGVGTVIFSFVTALTGLVYELLFGIMPKAIKLITKKFKRYMKVLYCYLYGGNA